MNLVRPCRAGMLAALLTVLPRVLAQEPAAVPPPVQPAAPAADGGKLVEGEKINPYTYAPKSAQPDASDPAQVDLRKAFEAMGPVAIEWYQHVQTLSNPFFEGRAPGSRGIELAAEYVEFWLKQAGLEPAFPVSPGSQERSWRQTFELEGGVPQVERSVVRANGVELARGTDYQVIGSSGSGAVKAPLVFAGYAIEEGKDGYTSFGPDEDFAGKVVMFLRYEPLDAEGRSRWSDRRFSPASAMRAKLDAISDRDPAAILMVNPPECRDGATGLEATESSIFGQGYDVPLIQLSQEKADEILRKADTQGRGLMDFRRLADEGALQCVSLREQAPMELQVAVAEKGIATANVGGVLKGRGKLADEWVVIGAHYDHVGMGYFGADPQNRGKLHPGADDNASGTAAMLCAARALRDHYNSPDAAPDLRSIIFLAFTAEEGGLDGSREFVKRPTMAADSIAAMINLDMVGRLRGDELAMSGTGTAENFGEIIRPAIARSGMTVKADPGGRGPSDHASFYAAGIPVLFIFTGNHGEYHKPEDRAFTVNPLGASKVIRLVDELARDLAAIPDKPRFTSTDGKGGTDRGYAKVRLGIQPSMEPREAPGLLIDDVSKDTSAADAGLKGGDVILMWNEHPVDDVPALMERLRDHEPGDVVKMKILRDGTEQVVDVTMKASSPRG
ncbi:MAG: M20/M25/M40 family metallo-hydrolase [Phycisphaerales bacterium]